jgi:hypothetical protein
MQAERRLVDIVRGRERRQTFGTTPQLVERAAVEEFHREIWMALGFADREHLHHVRVGHTRHAARLDQEALAHIAVDRERVAEEFHRDPPLQRRLVGQIHHAHAAAAKLADQFVGADDGVHGMGSGRSFNVASLPPSPYRFRRSGVSRDFFVSEWPLRAYKRSIGKRAEPAPRWSRVQANQHAVSASRSAM